MPRDSRHFLVAWGGRPAAYITGGDSMPLGLIVDRPEEVELPETIWVEGKDGRAVRVLWRNRPERRIKARLRLFEGFVEFTVTWTLRDGWWEARTPLTFRGKYRNLEGLRVLYRGKEVPLLTEARQAALGLLAGEQPGERVITSLRDFSGLPRVSVRPVRQFSSGKLAGLVEVVLERDEFEVALRMSVLRGEHGLWLAWPTYNVPAGLVSDTPRRVDTLRFYLPGEDGRNITGEIKAGVLLTWHKAVGSEEPISRREGGGSCMTCKFRQLLPLDGRIRAGEVTVEDRYYCGLHERVINPVTQADLYNERILPELDRLPKVGIVADDVGEIDVMQMAPLLGMLPREMLGTISIREPGAVEMELEPEDDESLRAEIARALGAVAAAPEREDEKFRQVAGRKWAPLTRSKYYDLWGSGCPQYTALSAPAWPVAEPGLVRIVARGDKPEVTIPIGIKNT